MAKMTEMRKSKKKYRQRAAEKSDSYYRAVTGMSKEQYLNFWIQYIWELERKYYKPMVRKQDMIAAGEKCLYCGIRVDSGHPETDCPYSGYTHDRGEIWATTSWHPGNFYNHYDTFKSLI